jgi:hypothetical protein
MKTKCVKCEHNKMPQEWCDRNCVKKRPIWISSKVNPLIGDYYYCQVETKQGGILKTIVEWGEFKHGKTPYWDWDLKNVQHFGKLNEEAEVIMWLFE